MALQCGFRGCLNIAAQNDVKVLVDYLCFTVKHEELKDIFPEDAPPHLFANFIRLRFYLGSSDLQYTERKAFYGYNISYSCQGITFCYGGRDDIYIQLSGQGCRFWETLNPSRDWYTYLQHLKTHFRTCHVSRLDIAGDAFGVLPMQKVMAATVKEQFVTKWRQYRYIGGNAECSVIFGSPKSEFRLRIYDKTHERKAAKCENVPENWVRVEMQMRNDSAEGFLQNWFDTNNLGTAYAGLLRNQLRYYSKYDGKNADRLQLTTWWAKFLGDTAQLPLPHQGGMEYNLERLERYIYHQAASSIKTLLTLQSQNGDAIDDFIEKVSGAKLNDAQKELLASAQYVPMAKCSCCGKTVALSDMATVTEKDGNAIGFCRRCVFRKV